MYAVSAFTTHELIPKTETAFGPTSTYTSDAALRRHLTLFIVPLAFLLVAISLGGRRDFNEG